MSQPGTDRSTGGQFMPLRRMIVVLSLSFLLSQQLLPQTPSQAPSSGSSAPQTSGTPNDNPAKAKCTETGTYVNSQGQTVKRPENCTTGSDSPMPRRNLQFQQEQTGHMLTSWRRGEVALIVESVTRERALQPRNTDDVSILHSITEHAT